MLRDELVLHTLQAHRILHALAHMPWQPTIVAMSDINTAILSLSVTLGPFHRCRPARKRAMPAHVHSLRLTRHRPWRQCRVPYTGSWWSTR